MDYTKLDRRSKYSLHAIRTALFILLEQKDLKSITVAELCRTADVNRGTFYKYYEDVADLFAKIETSVAEEACKIIMEDCLSNFSIEMLISHVLHSFMNNRDFIYIFAKNPSETQYLNKIISTFRPQFIETISNNSSFTEETDINACFEFILGGTVNNLLQWVQNGMDVPVEHMEKLLTRFIHSVLDTEN